MDGHRSHMTQEISKFCDDNGIVLISLLPNSTHILQPADVSVFKPLKAGWVSEVRTWKFENFPKDVTRYTFGSILKLVFDKYATEATIKNGFRKTGLYPFDENNVDFTKCIPNRKHVTHENEHSKDYLKAVLREIENRIDKEELEIFSRTCRKNEEWSGHLESTNLYKIWKQIKSECENISSETCEKQQESKAKEHTANDANNGIEMIPESDSNKEAEIENDTNKENQMPPEPEASCSYTVNASKTPEDNKIGYIATPERSWKTPEGIQYKRYEDKEKEGYKIPTPFKKILVFPCTPENKPKRRKTIFPAVVSSGKYREYYQHEQQKKLEKNIKTKRTKIPQSREKLNSKNESSSDSEENVQYEDEDLDLSDNEEDLIPGKYVIIFYENEYFPG